MTMADRVHTFIDADETGVTANHKEIKNSNITLSLTNTNNCGPLDAGKIKGTASRCLLW